MPRKNTSANVKLYAAVAVILIAAALVVTALYFTQPVSFSTFKSAFSAAPKVAIFASYTGNVLGQEGSATVGCATAIIEHLGRPANSIYFFVVNQTNCTFSEGGLGSGGNISTAGLGRCVNDSIGMPAIHIDYNVRNVTTVTRSKLYVSGDLNFLRQCGVAPMLGS